jgi:hypothetical protein
MLYIFLTGFPHEFHENNNLLGTQINNGVQFDPNFGLTDRNHNKKASEWSDMPNCGPFVCLFVCWSYGTFTFSYIFNMHERCERISLSYYDSDPSIQNLGRIVRHCLFVYHVINFETFLAIVCFSVSIISIIILMRISKFELFKFHPIFLFTVFQNLL